MVEIRMEALISIITDLPKGKVKRVPIRNITEPHTRALHHWETWPQNKKKSNKYISLRNSAYSTVWLRCAWKRWFQSELTSRRARLRECQFAASQSQTRALHHWETRPQHDRNPTAIDPPNAEKQQTEKKQLAHDWRIQWMAQPKQASDSDSMLSHGHKINWFGY